MREEKLNNLQNIKNPNDKLPDGWVETGIMEAYQYIPTGVKNFQGQKYYYSTGGISLRRSIPEGKYCFEDRPSRANRVVNAMDILQARMKSTNKAIIIKEQDGQLFSTGFIHFRAKNNDPFYLYYYFQSRIFLDQKDFLATGSTQCSLNDKGLKLIKIPLCPLNEQKRIVDKIEQLFSDLDKGEDLIKTIQKQLKTYRCLILEHAITGRLINSKSIYKRLKLGDFIEDIRYGTSNKCHKDQSLTPVLRIPNVVDGFIDLSDLKHAEFNDEEKQKLALRESDILIVRSNGSASLVGRTAVVDKKSEGYLYAGYLIRIRLRTDALYPKYLQVYLSSTTARNHIELGARSTSGVHNINSDEVKNIPITVPSLEEQKQIVQKVDKILSQIDSLEKWCNEAIIESKSLRQSILKSAFSGQLVSQDPNDEPASKLLEKIKEVKR